MLVTTQNMMVTTQNMFHLIESVDFIKRLHIIKQTRMKETCRIKLAMTNIERRAEVHFTNIQN